MKNVKSSQPCISMNFVKHKLFPVSIVKTKTNFLVKLAEKNNH